MATSAELSRRLEILFSGVESLTDLHAVGMTLYALAEFAASAPLRRFVFANWDEEEDDSRLEVLARDFECRERG